MSRTQCCCFGRATIHNTTSVYLFICSFIARDEKKIAERYLWMNTESISSWLEVFLQKPITFLDTHLVSTAAFISMTLKIRWYLKIVGLSKTVPSFYITMVSTRKIVGWYSLCSWTVLISRLLSILQNILTVAPVINLRTKAKLANDLMTRILEDISVRVIKAIECLNASVQYCVLFLGPVRLTADRPAVPTVPDALFHCVNVFCYFFIFPRYKGTAAASVVYKSKMH